MLCITFGQTDDIRCDILCIRRNRLNPICVGIPKVAIAATFDNNCQLDKYNCNHPNERKFLIIFFNLRNVFSFLN